MTPDDAVARPALVRAIGRWDLVATVVNSVIGSAIFGMPSAVAGYTGEWSPIVVLLAGLCVFPVVLCFAEVGSRFDGAGGSYLYARQAFGPIVGFQTGWLLLWSRLLSGGAVLNVLVTYLSQLVPWVGTPVGRAVLMTGAIVLVAAINIRGVRQAASVVNLFTLAKLLPLVLVIVAGAIGGGRAALATQTVARPNWTEALLLLVFAYGGFEASVIAAGETRRPREDTAFALVTGMLVITAIYASAQLAVVAVLPHAALSKAPIADALRATLGPSGTTIGSIAVVLSAYGWLTGFALLMPRVLYSMAERRELPVAFHRLHPEFRTPTLSIVVCSLTALAIGLYGTFTAAATMSAIARLVVFGVTCGSLVRLRRISAPRAGFVLPGGAAFAVFGILFSLWLLSTRNLTQAWMLGAIVVAGVVVRLSTGGRDAAAA